jgi:hypothetical protein
VPGGERVFLGTGRVLEHQRRVGRQPRQLPRQVSYGGTPAPGRTSSTCTASASAMRVSFAWQLTMCGPSVAKRARKSPAR